MPLFSICIPAHNAVCHIFRAFESIAKQTCSNWEIVIVDDASSDGLYSYLDEQSIIDRKKFRILDSRIITALSLRDVRPSPLQKVNIYFVWIRMTSLRRWMRLSKLKKLFAIKDQIVSSLMQLLV